MKILRNGMKEFSSNYELAAVAMFLLVFGPEGISETIADIVLSHVYVGNKDSEISDLDAFRMDTLEQMYNMGEDLLDIFTCRKVEIEVLEFIQTNNVPTSGYLSACIAGHLAIDDWKDALEILAADGKYEFEEDEDDGIVRCIMSAWNEEDEEDDEDWVEDLVTPVVDDFDRDPETGEAFDPEKGDE